MSYEGRPIREWVLSRAAARVLFDTFCDVVGD